MLKSLFFVLIIFFIITKNINANEIKSLSELKENNSSDNYSQILMERCAAIYAALSILENNNEYENRYKIFLQSSILEILNKNNNLKEEIVYKESIDDFKISLSFLLQILKQNYKINNSFLKNHWIEKDFNTCKKL